MMRMRRGQSTVELTVLIVTIAGALLLVFAFVRSSLVHRMHSGAYGIGHGMLRQ
ncbi:MAG: hypothetical protein HYT88_04505 [Candidatus Omnitrophica bacterium]|nr:hypothetical protein [Candidatus Omnitrophota bacterium]MBI2174143.1 hypothetical protein [Candidatus Omnitrophota bacterium]MBI3010852.1 hypothetical protein [Candidatus Omnitrophota bacterium]